MRRYRGKHFAVRLSRTLLVVGLVAPALPADAATYRALVSAGTQALGISGPSDRKDVTETNGVELEASSSQIQTVGPTPYGVTLDGSASIAVHASVAPGFIKILSTGSASMSNVGSTGPASAWGNASAYAWIDDTFEVAASSCSACAPGTVGHLRYQVRFDGSPSGGGTADGNGATGPAAPTWGGVGISWSTQLTVDGQSSVVANAAGEWANTTRGGVETTTSGVGLGTHEYDLTFVFGKPIEVHWNVSLGQSTSGTADSGGGSASASGHGTADFTHTFGWAGIVSMTDATGLAVDSFTAFNAVGVDYATNLAASPVPEPQTGGLLLAGLIAVGGIARRRRRL